MEEQEKERRYLLVSTQVPGNPGKIDYSSLGFHSKRFVGLNGREGCIRSFKPVNAIWIRKFFRNRGVVKFRVTGRYKRRKTSFYVKNSSEKHGNGQEREKYPLDLSGINKFVRTDPEAKQSIPISCVNCNYFSGVSSSTILSS